MLQEQLSKGAFALGEDDPIFFAEEILGIELNPFQKRSLTYFATTKQFLEITSNQVGKTVALAVVHIWFNFYKKGFGGDPKAIDESFYQTLNISPVSRQAKECARYVEEILLGKFFWETLDGQRKSNDCKIVWFWVSRNENLGRIEFSNNTFFYCLSTGEDAGGNLQGAQFALITYDECVQSHHLQEELGARIFSRTAKYNGTIVLISTADEMAKSQQYWFHLYTLCKKGDTTWGLVEGVYDENIFIAVDIREAFKARLKKHDPVKYQQVIFGKFLSSADRMFPPEAIEALWNGKEPQEDDGDSSVVIVVERIDGHIYVLIIDWGVADQGDDTVMAVADITDYYNPEIVASYVKQGGDPVELLAMASYLTLLYEAKMVMDAAEMGGIIFKKMMKEHNPIGFGQGNKPDALTYLQIRLRNNIKSPEKEKLTKGISYDTGFIKSYYIAKLENQLSAYKLDDKKIKQDWVMVLAMLCWYLEKYVKGSRMKSFPFVIRSN